MIASATPGHRAQASTTRGGGISPHPNSTTLLMSSAAWCCKGSSTQGADRSHAMLPNAVLRSFIVAQTVRSVCIWLMKGSFRIKGNLKYLRLKFIIYILWFQKCPIYIKSSSRITAASTEFSLSAFWSQSDYTSGDLVKHVCTIKKPLPFRPLLQTIFWFVRMFQFKVDYHKQEQHLQSNSVHSLYKGL